MALKSHQKSCPNCQQTITMFSINIPFVVCPHCAANLCLVGNSFNILQKNQKLPERQKSLTIGDIAHKDKQAYTVIGWIEYETLGKSNYQTWTEYVLATKNSSYLLLRESDEGWHVITYTSQLNDMSKKVNRMTNQVLGYDSESIIDDSFFSTRKAITISESPQYKISYMAGAFYQRSLINEIRDTKLYRIVIGTNSPKGGRALTYEYLRIFINQQWYWCIESFASHEQISTWFKKTVTAPAMHNVNGDKTALLHIGLLILAAITIIDLFLCFFLQGSSSKIMFSLITVIFVNALAAGLLYYLAMFTYIQARNFRNLGMVIIYIVWVLLGEIVDIY